MRGNTVTIEMPLKRGKVSKTIPLYQYDYGQKLLFTGIELPAYYEVHFSNEMHGEATTKIGTSEGVDIPDVYLSTGEPVYLWLYLHSEVTDGETEFQGSIPVIKRASISDQTPTEQEATVIAEAIVALNEAAEALDGAVESAEAAQEGAEAAEDGAEEQALKAEGYAIGKQAGEDVDSSSPYYHNNAKYYNDQAGSSATAASGSASAASGSATSAESWATGGSSGTPSATNNAKYYSEQAASSASTANSAKSDAVSAKNTAATWATGGTTGTPGSTNNAKYYSEQAAASASSSADNKTAAETAQGKAEAAQSAAETAQGKAEDAQGAAETAQGKAEDAQTAAETAQDKAEDAQDAAEAAQTAAEAAQTAAETAQGKAEDAQEAAEEAAGTMANKADKVASATSGNFAGLDSNGNLTDSGKGPDDLLELDADLEDSTKAAPADVVGQLALMKTDHIYNETEPSAICSVSDGAALPIKTLTVDIDPVQDLHGYDSPWPAGGGVNLFNIEDIAPFNENVTVTKTADSFTVTNNNSYAVSPFRGDGKDVEWNLAPGQYTISIGTALSKNLDVYASSDGTSYSWFDNGIVAGNLSKTFTVSAEKPFITIRGSISSNDSMTISKFQLESGSTATAYAPYENVCPISGWTEANVSRTGKNLLNPDIKAYFNDNMYFGSHSIGNVPDGTFILPAGTYTASASETMSAIYTLDSSGSSLGLVYNNTKITFTNPKTQPFLIRFYKANAMEQYFSGINMWMEYGSTATSYEPYSGSTAEYEFPQEAGTVYGGTLTIHQDGSGELVVDRASVEYDGSIDEKWYEYDAGSDHFCANMIPNNKKIGNQKSICNEFGNVNNAFSSSEYGIYSDHPTLANTYFRMPNSTVTTLAEFKSWIAQNPIQLVYELATPVTYQLTNQQVLTLLKGNNVVFADCGSVSIEYPADTKLYIDGKVAELQALILENISNS